MRIYETIYICPPTLDEEAQDEFADLVHEVIYDSGGKIIKQERWGKRRLAFEVKKFRDGIYFYFLYGGDGRTKLELERRLKLADECIRYLTVRLDKELQGKKHKIYTKEEVRLALQMESPKRSKPKPKPPAQAPKVPEERPLVDEKAPEEPETVTEGSTESGKKTDPETAAEVGAEPEVTEKPEDVADVSAGPEETAEAASGEQSVVESPVGEPEVAETGAKKSVDSESEQPASHEGVDHDTDKTKEEE